MLAKVRRIVAFFRRSAVAANAFKVQADHLGIPNKKFKIDVTRWNSAYEMIERYGGSSCCSWSFTFKGCEE